MRTGVTKEQRLARERREAIQERLARGLGHPHRVRIMEILSEGDAAGSEIALTMGEERSLIYYHLGVLIESQLVELVEVTPVKGAAAKKILRSTVPTHFSDLAWAALDERTRLGISETVVENVMRRIADAVSAKTFDSKADRHLTLHTISVDWRGWEEIVDLLAGAMAKIEGIALGAEGRAPVSERFPASVSLMSFESPRMYENPA